MGEKAKKRQFILSRKKKSKIETWESEFDLVCPKKNFPPKYLLFIWERMSRGKRTRFVCERVYFNFPFSLFHIIFFNNCDAERAMGIRHRTHLACYGLCLWQANTKGRVKPSLCNRWEISKRLTNLLQTKSEFASKVASESKTYK